MLLGWVPTGPWELTEFLSNFVLDQICLSQLLSERLKFEQVIVVLGLLIRILCFHIFDSLFEHLKSLLTGLVFFRFCLDFLQVCFFNGDQFLQLLVYPLVMIVDSLISLFVLLLEAELSFCSFHLLARVILNDQVLCFDLVRRAMDHVLDDELSVTELADATSQCFIATWCLLRSE